MQVMYKRPSALQETYFKYCGGCGHAIINKLIAEIIDEKFIRRYHFEYHMQAIWLAPQMRYLKDSMKKKLNCFDIPIHIIDMKTFGKMDGKQALQDILNAMI